MAALRNNYVFVRISLLPTYTLRDKQLLILKSCPEEYVINTLPNTSSTNCGTHNNVTSYFEQSYEEYMEKNETETVSYSGAEETTAKMENLLYIGISYSFTTKAKATTTSTTSASTTSASTTSTRSDGDKTSNAIFLRFAILWQLFYLL